MTFVATILFGLGFVMLVSAIDGGSIGDAFSSILSGTYNSGSQNTPSQGASAGAVRQQ